MSLVDDQVGPVGWGVGTECECCVSRQTMVHFNVRYAKRKTRYVKAMGRAPRDVLDESRAVLFIDQGKACFVHLPRPRAENVKARLALLISCTNLT